MRLFILFIFLSFVSFTSSAQQNKVGIYSNWAISQSSFSPSPESIAVFNRMSTPLPLNVKILINDFVNSQVAVGNWAKVIDFGYLGLDTETNSLTSWKGIAAPSKSAIYWQQYYGFKFTGSINNYMNLNFIPSSNTDFIIDNCGFGAFVKVDRYVSAQKALMGVTETTAANQIYLANTGSAIVGRVNNSTLSSNTAEGKFASGNWYAADRQNSTQVGLVKGATRVTSANSVGAAKPNQPLYLGGRRNNTSADLIWAGDISAWGIYQPVGFDLSAWNNGLTTLESGINAIFMSQVPNYDALVTSSSTLVVLLRLGQSNTNGKAEKSRMIALTDAKDLYQSCYVWDKGYNPTNNGFWNTAIAGVNIPPSAQTGGSTFSSAGVIRKLTSAAGYPTFIIDCAYDGSTAYTFSTYGTWEPGYAGANFHVYETARDGFWVPALNNLQAAYPSKTIKVVIEWQEGETSALDATATANHLTAFSNVITAVRASHSLLATCPLIIEKLYYNVNANEATINSQYDTYVGSNPNSYVIDAYSAVIAEGNAPRKQDLPSGIKTAYPPSGLLDDEHGSFYVQYKKATLTWNVLVSIGYL